MTTHSKPIGEALVLICAAIAVTVAAAFTHAFSSPEAWTLLAVLAAGYVLSRGAARARWSAGAPVAPRAATVAPASAAGAPAPAAAPSGPIHDEAADVTLAEERLEIDKVARPHERVVVRKEVVTELVTVTVPVRREELRIERVPVGEELAGDAFAVGADSAPVELVLMAEEPIVDKRVVPRERVRLHKDVVEDERRITETVRREEADVETIATHQEIR